MSDEARPGDYPAPPDREEQALQDILDRWRGDDLGPE